MKSRDDQVRVAAEKIASWASGLDSFTMKRDSYWNVPLNESLPELGFELPVMEGVREANLQLRVDF